MSRCRDNACPLTRGSQRVLFPDTHSQQLVPAYAWCTLRRVTYVSSSQRHVLAAEIDVLHIVAHLNYKLTIICKFKLLLFGDT
ncbi:hypothetical protein NDU88_000742 [Pleurodeles waltl]|uniref:Uncharacterized protein n=1 Tax=Pleurodeles waltl TaxID=8319 RepID=A0AAV7S8Y5_PLEWA|nr:hypothetical protein NDU88_000742 [Pleurodeles waltl]